MERTKGEKWMSGIFYDPRRRSLHRVHEAPETGWILVTHDVDASPNRCRRIMREWLPFDELFQIDWCIVTHSQARSA
jgi:hypothetical protein